jgi:hypothetical protein
MLKIGCCFDLKPAPKRLASDQRFRIGIKIGSWIRADEEALFLRNLV